MKKADRQRVFDKFGGKCAYCGCELTKGWHVDELQPCRRKYRWEKGHFREGKTILTIQEANRLSESEMAQRGIKWIAPRYVFDGYEHPERLHVDNQMPACASCNINKHSMSLEQFRQLIAGFIKHLNGVNTQYKIAKRYGLVQETGNEVKFYFEMFNQNNLK